MNIHFKIKDLAVIEALESRLKELNQKEGDWRYRNAGLAKAIVEYVVLKRPDIISELMSDEKTTEATMRDDRVFKRDIPLKENSRFRKKR